MKKQKTFLILGLFFFLLFYGAKDIFGQEETTVFIVKSRNSEPYNGVALTVKEALQERWHNLKITELDYIDESKAGQINSQIESAKPTLIITLGTPATKAIRQLPGKWTVVYTMILDPLRSNINPPGVAMDISTETKLREFKRIIPGVKKLGVIYSSSSSSAIGEISGVCNRLGLGLVTKKIEAQKDFPQAMEEVFKEADSFLMLADPDIYLPKITEQLLLEGLQRKIPIIGLSSAYAKAGALIAFDCDYADLGKQTAELTLRILSKDEQALKEMATPRKITYSLNLQVAERLQANISSEMLKGAAEVFGK